MVASEEGWQSRKHEENKRRIIQPEQPEKEIKYKELENRRL